MAVCNLENEAKEEIADCTDINGNSGSNQSRTSKPLSRESLFELNPQPIREIRDYLNVVSAEWDQALARLKAFVEE